MPLEAIEFLASLFGIAGTLLLAWKGRFAGWGFVCYLASNVGWLWFSHSHGYRWLLAQTVAFTAISLFGIWTWLVRPALGNRRSQRD